MCFNIEKKPNTGVGAHHRITQLSEACYNITKLKKCLCLFLDLSRYLLSVQLYIDGYIELHDMIVRLLQYHKGYIGHENQ